MSTHLASCSLYIQVYTNHKILESLFIPMRGVNKTKSSSRQARISSFEHFSIVRGLFVEKYRLDSRHSKRVNQPLLAAAVPKYGGGLCNSHFISQPDLVRALGTHFEAYSCFLILIVYEDRQPNTIRIHTDINTAAIRSHRVTSILSMLSQ